MKNIQTLDQIKDKYYGAVGAPERDRLENELEALRIGLKFKSRFLLHTKKRGRVSRRSL